VDCRAALRRLAMTGRSSPLTTYGAVHIQIAASHRNRALLEAYTLPFGDWQLQAVPAL
jgi:hypothetical protein